MRYHHKSEYKENDGNFVLNYPANVMRNFTYHHFQSLEPQNILRFSSNVQLNVKYLIVC